MMTITLFSIFLLMILQQYFTLHLFAHAIINYVLYFGITVYDDVPSKY